MVRARGTRRPLHRVTNPRARAVHPKGIQNLFPRPPVRREREAPKVSPCTERAHILDTGTLGVLEAAHLLGGGQAMENALSKAHLAVGVLVSALLASLSPAAVHAACPLGVLKSGVATMPTGTAGISVPFTNTSGFLAPLPSACTQYVVVLTQSNDGAYSPTPNCTYLNVLDKTTTGFEVQHKGCADGIPYNVTGAALEFNWVAVGGVEPPLSKIALPPGITATCLSGNLEEGCAEVKFQSGTIPVELPNFGGEATCACSGGPLGGMGGACSFHPIPGGVGCSGVCTQSCSIAF